MSTPSKRPVFPVLIGLGLTAFTPGASGAQSYAQQVWDQLQSRYQDVTRLGDYTLMNYVMGKLNDDAKDTWTFPLSSSTAYVLTAACDNDCSDIDLRVTDPSGGVVVEDVQRNDFPVVAFIPPRSATYTIEITMYACRSNPCYFGFGIFQR